MLLNISDFSLFQGFKNLKSWYTFFRAPNNMFVSTFVDLTFHAPQIVLRGRVDASPTTKIKIL